MLALHVRSLDLSGPVYDKALLGAVSGTVASGTCMRLRRVNAGVAATGA